MSYKICVVDDEAGIGDMCKDFLANEFSVRTFTSPKEASQAIGQSYMPDLVVTDIKMPEMDGFSLVKEVHSRVPELPVVMMSGYAEKRHVLEAIEADAQGFLEKPFNPNRMKELIFTVLKKMQYMHAMKDLLKKYDALNKVNRELNKMYLERYAAAENKLEEENLQAFGGKEQVKEFLKTMKLENQLDSFANKLIEEIDMVLAGQPEIGSLVASTQIKTLLPSKS